MQQRIVIGPLKGFIETSKEPRGWMGVVDVYFVGDLHNWPYQPVEIVRSRKKSMRIAQ